MYDRGSADNKSGVISHAAALRLYAGRPPVGVIVLADGEEQIGSPSLPALFAREPELSGVDIAVVSDSGSMVTGRPALNVPAGGLLTLIIEVQTMERRAHAGVFGGAVPQVH